LIILAGGKSLIANAPAYWGRDGGIPLSSKAMLPAEKPKIETLPPGPKARRILERELEVLSLSVIRRYPLIIRSALGSFVEDVDGNVYIDFDAGNGIMILGYQNSDVIEALKDQAEAFISEPCPDLPSAIAVDMAEELIRTFGKGDSKRIFLCSSRSEAIEASLKVARWFTRNTILISHLGAFYGETYGALSLSSGPKASRRRFGPMVPSIFHVPYPYCYRCPYGTTYPDCAHLCLSLLREQILENLIPIEDMAAFILKPILPEGCVIAPEGYFQRLRRIAEEGGFLLIDDETWTAGGRTGKWLALDHWETKAEVVCMASTITSGIPFGILMTEKSIMDWEPGAHVCTSGLNSLACKVALATMEVLRRERLLVRANNLGRVLMKRIQEMAQEFPLIGDVRGKGLMVGIEIVKDREKKIPGAEEKDLILKRAWKRGLILGSSDLSTILLTPALNIPDDILERGLTILEDVLRIVQKDMSP
jgi:4-aminobutyrate aminotransferase